MANAHVARPAAAFEILMIITKNIKSLDVFVSFYRTRNISIPYSLLKGNEKKKRKIMMIRMDERF